LTHGVEVACQNVGSMNLWGPCSVEQFEASKFFAGSVCRLPRRRAVRSRCRAAVPDKLLMLLMLRADAAA